MKTVSTLLIFVTQLCVALCEQVTILHPTSTDQWFQSNLEKIEWKYSPDFPVESFQSAVVDLMQGTPGDRNSHLTMNVETQEKFEYTGVGLTVPESVAPGNYYVRVTVITSQGNFEADSQVFKIGSRQGANSANSQILDSPKSVSSETPNDATTAVSSGFLALLAAAGAILLA